MLTHKSLAFLQRTAPLPAFPRFASLTPNHQSELRKLTQASPLYSDYNFISLWSWDHRNKLRVCTLNGNLVVRFQDYAHPRHLFYSFFGTVMPDETACTLLGYLQGRNTTELRLVPEFVVQSFKHPEQFLITEDRDSFDYIIAAEDLAELKGKRHKSKRGYSHRFHHEHAEHLQVGELDLASPKTAKEVLRLAKLWGEQKGPTKTYNKSELRAITKVVKRYRHIDTANLHVLGIYIDDELKAFSISEILGGGFAMGHYKKADRSVAGLGVVLDQYTSKTLREKGVTHINHEQDLGLEGLRQAKLASHPVYFLKKYRVALADGAQT